MKKLSLRLIALVLPVLLLVGCGEVENLETEVPTSSETTAPTIPTALTLGGTAPDLTFTDGAGEQISLYGLLKEKKLVVLNFWFADCGWCRREFPVMELAYQRYREDVEILAIDPYDSAAEIADFQKENSLSFPMLQCSEELAIALGVNGYPTSVLIDAEGKISLIHAGAITDTEIFNRLFETYTASDYRSRVYNSIYEILE
jgi:thiol-disulfide isomerase/thioredoxin